MLPTIEEYMASSPLWRRTHRGVDIKISHHGVSEYSPQGTWCYYLILHEIMFQRPEDWMLFDLPVQIKPSTGDKFWEHFPYDDTPDLNWHGGPTWGDVRKGFNRETGKPYKIIEIGCDYGHAFDRDGGYWQGFDDVLRDAERSAEALLKIAPQKTRCGYCGRVDMPDRFYTAINGARVHVEAQIPEGWDTWKPAIEAVSA